MKRMKSVLLGGLAALPVLTALAVNFPCGTFVIVGSVRNSKNEVFQPEDGIVIQALNESGTVLSESSLTGSTTEGYNCTLDIPVSTESSDQTVAVGDAVSLAMKVGTELTLAANTVIVTGANLITNLTVKVADVEKWVNPTNAKDVVYIAVDYTNSIAPWVSYMGKTCYDPFADWDCDGSLNWQEYESGTSPIDPHSCLKITDAKMTSAGNFLLKFAHVGGHVYGVNATTNLTDDSWSTKLLKTDDDSSAATLLQIAVPGTSEEVGETVIYVVPAAKSEFFTLQGK